MRRHLLEEITAELLLASAVRSASSIGVGVLSVRRVAREQVVGLVPREPFCDFSVSVLTDGVGGGEDDFDTHVFPRTNSSKIENCEVVAVVAAVAFLDR